MLYHTRAEIVKWSNLSLKIGRNYQFLVRAEEDIKEEVKRATGLPLDEADPTGHDGNANKGDLCKKLMVDHRP